MYVEQKVLAFSLRVETFFDIYLLYTSSQTPTPQPYKEPIEINLLARKPEIF